jgi:hypothetical protein
MPGGKDLALWQLHVVPHDVFMLVPRVRGFDQVGLRAHPQHQVDQLDELDVEGVRAVPAAPAQVIANTILGKIA